MPCQHAQLALCLTSRLARGPWQAVAARARCWSGSDPGTVADTSPPCRPPRRPAQNFYNTSPEADKFAAVRSKIGDVKDIMVQNIEKVLQRGEKIELLVDKSDALNRSAAKFEKSSNKLKNQMWWRNVKMWLLIAFIVLVVIYIIMSLICGWDFKKCGAK